MADLNQFLNKDLSADDIAHPNGYGAAAGGRSMEERRKHLDNRVVGEYKWSDLGRRGAAVKAKTANQQSSRSFDASTNSFTDNASYSSHQRGGKVEEPTQPSEAGRREHFIEPPTRGYDKYA